MKGTLSLRNRQRIRPVDTALLRRLTLALLRDHLGAVHFELGIHLVAAPEMARVNETFLGHPGSTDVITFDHSGETAAGSNLQGELFICLDDAVSQARQFRTTWPRELARYVIHGLLHLSGYDDRSPVARRRMKARENKLLREASASFPLARLHKRNPRRDAGTHARRGLRAAP